MNDPNATLCELSLLKTALHSTFRAVGVADAVAETPIALADVGIVFEVIAGTAARKR